MYYGGLSPKPFGSLRELAKGLGHVPIMEGI
jgi:hypothetical protein